MSYEHAPRSTMPGAWPTTEAAGDAPGKRSMTEALPPRAAGDASSAAAGAGESGTDLVSAGPTAEGPEEARDGRRKITAPVVGGGAEGEAGTPEAEKKDKPVAKLHLFADIEAPAIGIKELLGGEVGHTWIAIEYNDPATVPDTVPDSHKALLKNGGRYSDPMGFWPDTQNDVYYNPNPFNSYVQGWMRHPDRAHEGAEKAMQTWSLTQSEVDAVIAYAEGKRGAKYSVYFFNCTTFGVEAVQAAGKSAPSASLATIRMPNALYNGIKARQEKGVGETMVKDFDGTNERTSHGADAEKKN